MAYASFLAAVKHLRAMIFRGGDPFHEQPGMKTGKAVEPEDFAARLVILDWIREVNPDGLLGQTWEGPMSMVQLFNHYMDETWTWDQTLDECIRRSEVSGHVPTSHQVWETGTQLARAWKLQYKGFGHFPPSPFYKAPPFIGPLDDPNRDPSDEEIEEIRRLHGDYDEDKETINQ